MNNIMFIPTVSKTHTYPPLDIPKFQNKDLFVHLSESIVKSFDSQSLALTMLELSAKQELFQTGFNTEE